MIGYALAGPAFAQAPPVPAAKPAAATPAPAKPPEKAPAATQPGQFKHLAASEAAGILGRPVRGPKGDIIGRIANVLVDQAGHPRAAVIDFGGFMGVGSRKIAVEWPALHFAPGNSDVPVTLDLSSDQIKAAPEYNDDNGGKPATVVAKPHETAPAASVATKPEPAKPPATP